MSKYDVNRAPYLQASIRQAIGSLDLDVELELSSPWTVLFGPSGAGKSSLLRFLAGLTPPDVRGLSPGAFHRSRRAGISSGHILFRDRVWMDAARAIWLAPAARRVGFVTQRPALFPHMSVADNVGFGIMAEDGEERSRRVREMLSLFSAGQLAHRRPAALSGGEKQRVALARALAPKPDLLLLDEPFTGLDAPLKQSILTNLTRWLEQKRIPAIYVSHDVAEVFATQAEVVLLRHGRIEAQGPAESVLARERKRLLEQLQPQDVPYHSDDISHSTQTGSISR